MPNTIPLRVNQVPTANPPARIASSTIPVPSPAIAQVAIRSGVTPEYAVQPVTMPITIHDGMKSKLAPVQLPVMETIATQTAVEPNIPPKHPMATRPTGRRSSAVAFGVGAAADSGDGSEACGDS